MTRVRGSARPRDPPPSVIPSSPVFGERGILMMTHCGSADGSAWRPHPGLPRRSARRTHPSTSLRGVHPEPCRGAQDERKGAATRSSDGKAPGASQAPGAFTLLGPRPPVAYSSQGKAEEVGHSDPHEVLSRNASRIPRSAKKASFAQHPVGGGMTRVRGPARPRDPPTFIIPRPGLPLLHRRAQPGLPPTPPGFLPGLRPEHAWPTPRTVRSAAWRRGSLSRPGSPAASLAI